MIAGTSSQSSSQPEAGRGFDVQRYRVREGDRERCQMMDGAQDVPQTPKPAAWGAGLITSKAEIRWPIGLSGCNLENLRTQTSPEQDLAMSPPPPSLQVPTETTILIFHLPPLQTVLGSWPEKATGHLHWTGAVCLNPCS